MWILAIFGFIALAEGSVQLVSSPGSITPTRDPLVITCNFTKDPDSEMSKFHSLRLYMRPDKDKPFIELLVISSYEPVHVVEVTGDFVGGTSGFASEKGEGCFLQAEIFEPTEADAGQYLCQSHGYDKYTHDISSDSNLLLIEAQSSTGGDTTAMEERISELEKELKEAKQGLDECGAAVPFWFTAARDLTKPMAQKDANVFGITEVFNSTSYYIIVLERVDFDGAVQICKDYNGYLLELNSEDELIFVEDALKDIIAKERKRARFQGLITGAFLSDLDSPWKFMTHPEDEVYDGTWEAGQPDRDSMEFNWLVLKYKSGKLLQIDGKKNFSKYGAVCEISKDKF